MLLSYTHFDSAPIEWNDPRGYVRLRLPAHPLANKKGVVPRHRAVLWEALGMLWTSECHWCGYELPWKTTLRPAFTHVVHVDHLNETPGDDQAANLVPSCFWCNSHRGYMTRCAPAVWVVTPARERNGHE